MVNKHGVKYCAICRYKFNNNSEKFYVGLGRAIKADFGKSKKTVCEGCFDKFSNKRFK